MLKPWLPNRVKLLLAEREGSISEYKRLIQEQLFYSMNSDTHKSTHGSRRSIARVRMHVRTTARSRAIASACARGGDRTNTVSAVKAGSVQRPGAWASRAK